jgi:hypothetical protein
MKRHLQAVLISLSALSLLFLSACAKKSAATGTPTRQANAKLQAIKDLADALPKDPEGMNARGALEVFRATPMDIENNPQQADEIREIYTQRIQGKYKGTVAQEFQAEMAPFLASKKGK